MSIEKSDLTDLPCDICEEYDNESDLNYCEYCNTLFCNDCEDQHKDECTGL